MSSTLAGIAATCRWRELIPGLGYDLEKIAPVTVLLIGTGTIPYETAVGTVPAIASLGCYLIAR